MKSNKIYYKTEYRKKIKALSKFNIFIKDRISKKDVIQEVKQKKKKSLLGPILYKNCYNLYDIISKLYNKWVYKRKYNIKYSLYFLCLRVSLNKKWNFFKNQLVFESLFNGFIYFFLVVNWLWVSEWNKWISLTNIVEYSFFTIDIILKFVKKNHDDYIPSLSKYYNTILFSFFYNINCFNNFVNLYNMYLFDSLDIFFALYNIEEFKLEYEKSITDKKKWKDIRKASFYYLDKDILNDYYNISFFTFCIYEFNVVFSEYNLYFLTLKFFEYWVNCIIEFNNRLYLVEKKKELFKFNLNNLKNVDIKIYRNNFFPIRVKYNLFISNIDYFIFLKFFTYNFYIRSCNYFFEFASHRKYFLIYHNNPASINKGSLATWDNDKLYKSLLILLPHNINKNFNFYNMKELDLFSSFFYRKYDKKIREIMQYFGDDFNIRFLHKLKNSSNYLFSINKFFNYNLIDFYNLKNKVESYKNVMAINSVYEYRFANSSFKTMEEFLITIFKTPLEYYRYFSDLYKNFSYNVIFNIFNKYKKYFFFEDLFNCDKISKLTFYLHFLRFFCRLFNVKIFFFKYNLLWDLIENERHENLLKIKVFSKFYDFFEKKKIFIFLKKIKKKNYINKWSIQKFFNIIKYNSMFYLDIYSMNILFSGWIYEILFSFRYMLFVNIYNKFVDLNQPFDNYKFIVSLKDFYFQLIIENIELFLIIMFFFKKNLMRNYLFLNKKNKISNNFIYRKYTLFTWLNYNYYNDVFDDLESFCKDLYSEKLNKWILRYFYNRSELYMFYSESLINSYINRKRILL